MSVLVNKATLEIAGRLPSGSAGSERINQMSFGRHAACMGIQKVSGHLLSKIRAPSAMILVS